MMKRLLAFVLGVFPALVGAGNGPHSCVWGSACTFPVDIYAPDGVDFALTADIAVAAGDIEWYCPGQGVSSGTLSVTEIAPRGFVLTVPSALTDCARFEVKIRDADATPAYLSMSAHVETCGNASAAQVNCTSALSTHAATDIVTGGAINTTGGAVDTVTDVTNLESLNATARSQIETEALQAQSAHRLNELVLNALTAQPAAGSLWGDVTEDDTNNPGTQRFTAAALAEAPTGGVSDVNVNSWNGVLLSTTNPLPNAAPGANGGLPTVNATSQLVQAVSAYEVTDKAGYQANVVSYDAALDFNANQQATIQTQSGNAINNARLNELVQAPLTAQPAAGSVYGDLTQDSTAIPGTQQFTADALAQTPAAPVDEEGIRSALGAFGGTVQTIQDVTNFVVVGPNVPTSAGDLIDQEYTVVFVNAADNDSPSCHRQIQGFSAPTGLLTIPTPCTQNVAINDEVIFLPNGAGAEIASVNVNNGQVETDLTVNVDGALSLGCMLSAINAVQTGAQTVVGGTDYTYRNPGDTENRVVATRTASGRTQATITCPAGL